MEFDKCYLKQFALKAKFILSVFCSLECFEVVELISKNAVLEYLNRCF